MLIFELKCTSFKTQQLNLFVPTWRKKLIDILWSQIWNFIEFSFAEHHMYYLDTIVFLSLAEERKSHAYISYSSEIDNS